MNVKFDPNNVVIQLCMSGLNLEDSGKPEDAAALFHKAWHEAAAFTKEKSEEDLELGRQVLEAVGYAEHTSVYLLPEVYAYKNCIMLTIFILIFSIFLVVYILLFIYLRKQRNTFSNAKAAIRGFFFAVYILVDRLYFTEITKPKCSNIKIGHITWDCKCSTS
jgi:hypothetical protein